MNRGKDICKELKAVRKRIAEENDIPLEIKECTYKGPCRGTCPRCEAEVRYLENSLANRLKMGKVASVAGIALTLASPAVATAQTADSVPLPPSHERQVGICSVTGVVVDSKTREVLPYVSVILYKDTTKAIVTQTDFEGRYRFSVLAGHYTLMTKCVGYNEYRREVDIKGPNVDQGTMALEAGDGSLDTIKLEEAWTGLVSVDTVDARLKGMIIDEKTAEAMPFVNVVLRKGVNMVKTAVTDFDGIFILDDLEEGEYVLDILYIGYERKTIPVKIPQDFQVEPVVTIKLKSSATVLGGVIEVMGGVAPLMDFTTPGITVGTEIQGVKVQVHY